MELGDEYVKQLKERYFTLVESIQDVKLIDTLDELISDCNIYSIPASRTHHTYKWGLLEHCVEVAEFADRFAAMSGAPVTRDYIIVCGLLHDYGKAVQVGFSFPGYYQHSMIGAQKVGEELVLRGVSDEEVRYITNIIGSHHRNFESVKTPGDCLVHTCIENYLIYQADGLSAMAYVSRYNRDTKSNRYDCYGEHGLTFTKEARG